MIGHWRVYCGVAVLCVGLTDVFPRGPGSGLHRTISPAATYMATSHGLELGYPSAGRGPAIVLLHGYAETSRMWRPLRPLAPGGDEHSRDRPRFARDRWIGDSVRRAGHDTGRRPHACAGEEPGREQGGRRRTRHRVDGRLRVRRPISRRRRSLVLMDAFLPGVEGWEEISTVPRFGTSASMAPRRKPLFAVVSGRIRALLERLRR